MGRVPLRARLMPFNWPTRWSIGSCAELFALDHSVQDLAQQLLGGDVVGVGIVGANLRQKRSKILSFFSF